MTRLPPALRDIAADGATAACAEVEWKHQAVLLDPLLKLLQRCAGLRDRDAGGGVDLFNRIHALHRQHDFVRIRQRAAHQPGHAALRRHRHAVTMTEPQQGGHLRGRPRAHDRTRLRHRIARQIVMIARVDLGAAQDRALVQRAAQFVDEAVVGHAPAFFFAELGRSFTSGPSGIKPGPAAIAAFSVTRTHALKRPRLLAWPAVSPAVAVRSCAGLS